MNAYTEAIRNINSGLSKKDKALVEEHEGWLVQHPEQAAAAIKEHYNNLYNTDNGGAGITTYLKESLIREIMQNIIDCSYEAHQHLHIQISFDSEKRHIIFRYNEKGFRLSDVISFLSLNHTSKDSSNTGAFGIGAKGAMLTAEGARISSVYKDGGHCLQLEMAIHSVNISDMRTIQITELSLCTDQVHLEHGTTFTLHLSDVLYKEVVQDLLTLTSGGKGIYLTPIDLVFAALKKPNRTISIAIENTTYVIRNDYSNADSMVSFKMNNGEGATLAVYRGKQSQFEYLLPKIRYGNDLPAFIKDWSYNLFSTYELTGQLANPNLPVIYINIPTTDQSCLNNSDEKYYITSDRKGIQENKREMVEQYIAEDIAAMIHSTPEESLFIESTVEHEIISYLLLFLYEFIEYKQRYSNTKQWEAILNLLLDRISLKFKDNPDYYRLRDFKVFRMNIPKDTDIPSGKYIFANLSNGIRAKSTSSKYNELKFIFDIAISDQNQRYKLRVSQNEVYEPKYEAAPEQRLVIKLLNRLNQRDQGAFSLLSAESDAAFTQATLGKLLKAIKNDYTITRYFDTGERTLTVGGRSYYFPVNFELSDVTLLTSGVTVESNDQEQTAFHRFLVNLFRHSQLKNVDHSKILACIKCYMGFRFVTNENSFNNYGVGHTVRLTPTYNASNSNQLDILYHSVVIDQFDVSGCREYDELKAITGIDHPEWFLNRSLKEYFSITGGLTDEYYDFESDTISRVTGKPIETIIELMDKIVFIEAKPNSSSGGNVLDFGKDSYVLGIERSEDSKIKHIKKFGDRMEELSYCEFICIFPGKLDSDKQKRLSKSDIAKLLDGLLLSGSSISKVYSRSVKPIVKLYDQFSPYCKPRQNVTTTEFEVLQQICRSESFRDDKKRKIYFTKDLSNTLFGYSTCCAICDYESNILNSFKLKDSIKYDQNAIGKEFKISLYLCANHYFEAEAFSVVDIRFGANENVPFVEWLQYLGNNRAIPADYLNCTMYTIKRIVVQTAEFYQDEDNYTTDRERTSVLLTPLMALKWYLDNRSQ